MYVFYVCIRTYMNYLYTFFCISITIYTLNKLYTQVEDYCSLHTRTPSPPVPPSLIADTQPSSRYILFLSGMEFGSPLILPDGDGLGVGGMGTPPLELSAQMVTDFVGGRIGGAQAGLVASRIVRWVVVTVSVCRYDACRHICVYVTICNICVYV